MTKFALRAVLFAAALPMGCSDTVDIQDFPGYGAGHPGAGKVHGGQVIFQVVHQISDSHANIFGYARDFTTTPDPESTLPVPTLPSMECSNISTPVFPRVSAEGSVFQDLGPTLTLSTATVAHEAPQKADFTDNNQYKIPLGYTNPSFDLNTVQHGEFYDVNFVGVEQLKPSRMFFARQFDLYTPALAIEPVVLTKGQPLEFTWSQSDTWGDGTGEHTADRTFGFVILIGPGNATTGQVKWLCPINDGQNHSNFTVPATVVDQLPPTGQVLFGQISHMMAEYQNKRFDLITIECKRSPWSFAP